MTSPISTNPKLTVKQRRQQNRFGKPCQICNELRILVDHHLEGRDFNGYNQGWNRASICDNCHRDVHSNLIIIEGWFQTTSGRQLLWYRAEESGLTGQACHPPFLGAQTSASDAKPEAE
jgi:5-methylcytosine-specific restriction endonuclease McrA